MRGRMRLRCATAAARHMVVASTLGRRARGLELQAAAFNAASASLYGCPNRVEAVVVLLACSRNGYVCNPSLHQNYTVSDVVQLLERIQSAVLFAQPGYGADRTTGGRLCGGQRAAGDEASLSSAPGRRPPSRGGRSVQLPSAGPLRSATKPPELNPDKNCVSRLYIGHNRHAERRAAFGQHAARQRARDVRDWGHHAKTILVQPQPAVAPHRHGRRSSKACVAGFEVVVNDLPPGMKPLDWIVETRRHLCAWACRPTRWTSSPT